MNETLYTADAKPGKHAHPLVFLFLYIPFGVVSGYVSVTLGYLYANAGASVEAVAALVAAGLLPQVIKFLWAPLVDTTFSLKKWYIISGIITAGCILATGIIPVKVSNLPQVTLLVVIANVASSFLGTAVTALAAHDTPDKLRGVMSGFLQAGNLGGSGLGGGAALWLAHLYPQIWLPATAMTFCCVFCGFALYFVHEHPSTIIAEGVIKTWETLAKDIWDTMKTRMGVLAMVLCFLPLGTGAASGLFAAVAKDWHASAGTVELYTGVLNGVLTALGCLIGGFLCDIWDRKMAYVIFGLLGALCAVGMAVMPHTELMYEVWVSVYAIAVGLSYAGFSAFVFEAIGKGAAATKYNVYASLSNAPIYYMTIAEGKADTFWGVNGVLYSEAVCAVIAIGLFMALLYYANQKPASANAISA